MLFLASCLKTTCHTIEFITASPVLVHIPGAFFALPVPCLYYVVLSQQRAVLSNEEAVAWEESNGYPTIGHLTFLFTAYKPK